MPLVHADQPDAYAFEAPEEAQSLAIVYLQSQEPRQKQSEGRGAVRTLSPGTTFTLADHSEHDLDLLNLDGDANQFVVLNVAHRSRNNMSADAKAGLQQLLNTKDYSGCCDELAGITNGNRPGLVIRRSAEMKSFRNKVYGSSH